ncbi:MAG: hypothetical protein EA344_09785 [Alkalicoccus sp.]|nr:MAG: hypothetical protein EA344_09785 [Alkalicoccus sp.]
MYFMINKEAPAERPPVLFVTRGGEEKKSGGSVPVILPNGCGILPTFLGIVPALPLNTINFPCISENFSGYYHPYPFFYQFFGKYYQLQRSIRQPSAEESKT